MARIFQLVGVPHKSHNIDFVPRVVNYSMELKAAHDPTRCLTQTHIVAQDLLESTVEDFPPEANVMDTSAVVGPEFVFAMFIAALRSPQVKFLIIDEKSSMFQHYENLKKLIHHKLSPSAAQKILGQNPGEGVQFSAFKGAGAKKYCKPFISR
jgi:hypothetical protein